MSNEEQMRSEFIATGMWPNEVMYGLWVKSWKAATASKQRDIDALNQQVLELSAQVEKMREFIQMLADSSPADDMDSTPFDAQEFLTYLANAPSTALRDYVNEEVAMALEEAADTFADNDTPADDMVAG